MMRLLLQALLVALMLQVVVVKALVLRSPTGTRRLPQRPCRALPSGAVDSPLSQAKRCTPAAPIIV